MSPVNKQVAATGFESSTKGLWFSYSACKYNFEVIITVGQVRDGVCEKDLLHETSFTNLH